MLGAYKQALSDGYSQGQAFGALMWLGSYNDWVKTMRPISEKYPAFVSGASKVGNTVKGVVGASFNLAEFVSWCVVNWQVSIVGGLALLLLIKRL